MTVQNSGITVLNVNEQDYTSLTDILGDKEGDSRATDRKMTESL